ncbi:Hypothetical protein GbCGDNIH2_5003 [Granulibacter bethesdensis]|uniref:Uncharacterized protein n=1 Tax=Granulibacter bethesdensis (strain ATCC BAA-1260 / CGDNIH1) TaxID=391165 RepID=A0A286M2U0_GRABC|nr:Hypothetical protein GbCGDNIH2_5003 [Granulibacter bethesdensis]APH50780.1 Hypothetical protein GbCGDNIH5_5003 [Granulibacter bethesdensis]APH63475.1 Hypothetical protein GbCGDNIH1I4_5003 [Granulibacter bethesdensis]ASV62339.1 Hypothetical protein GbCGDNIH1_5003 [Granulibacter bethesdensis CGDNIH1]
MLSRNRLWQGLSVACFETQNAFVICNTGYHFKHSLGAPAALRSAAAGSVQLCQTAGASLGGGANLFIRQAVTDADIHRWGKPGFE